jgi:MFS family permease
MITYVAIPYQVQELTQSVFLVGLLGAAQLVPLVLSGLVGGTYADRLDRRKLILTCEFLMCAGTMVLVLNSLRAHPSVALLFATTAFMQAVNGFHRPSLEAMTQRLVDKSDYAAVGALNSMQRTGGAILGPMLGGVLLASGGAAAAYLVDSVTFVWAFVLIAFLKKSDFIPSAAEASPLQSFRVGIRFAVSKPELLGSYFVDIVAMTFAFPVALFPALAQGWGGETAAGILYSSMSIGSLAVALFSGRFRHYRRHGAIITVAAAVWGVFIVGFGFASSLWVAVMFLALAGAADMVSGVYRSVLWNQVIPNEMRGRLAGVEMISYMIGPLLGNLRVGTQASFTGNEVAIVSGGALCTLACAACIWIFPKFWAYREAAELPR